MTSDPRRRKANLPADGDQAKLLLPGGEVMPVRVTGSGDDVIMLVHLLKRQAPLPGEGPPVLEWTSSRGVVRIEGSVEWEESDLVRFEVADVVDVDQRREHVRVRVPRPIMLAVESSPRGLGTFAIDLSGGGMLLAGPDTLKVGDRIRFRLRLDAANEPIDGVGRVVRYGAGGYRAIAFDELGEADRERLIHFIFEFERASRRVRRDDDAAPGS